MTTGPLGLIAPLGRSGGGDPMTGLLILGALVLVFGGVIALTKLAERRRRALLADFAPSIGMDFSPDDDVAIAARLARLPLFDRGRSRRTFNVMRGTSHGRQLVVFDYHYKTGSGKHVHHHVQTVAFLRFDGVDLPRFWMRPQGVLDKLASLVGMHDVDFTDDETFSRRWFLKTDDEPAVRRLFTPRVRGQFPAEPRLQVEAAGPDLIVYRGGKKAGPDEIRALLEDAFRLAELFTRDGTRAGS